MAALRIIWVGRSDRGFIADGVAHYLKRIAPLQAVETVTVRAAAHSGRDTAAALQREGQALLRHLGPEELLVLLDERGRRADSRGFAEWLGGWLRGPHRSVTLAVGGAYGFSEAVRARADHTVSLSPLTFPHQLVRLVLLEQVYRALTLLAGHGYHHD